VAPSSPTILSCCGSGQAAQRLDAVHARFHAPELVLQAQTALATALLLRPAEPAAAELAFRQALAVDPDYRPSPRELAPRAAGLLERQRSEASAPRPPTTAELAWLARQAGLDRLVWVGLDRGGRAEVVLFDVRVERARVCSAKLAEPTLDRVARLVHRALGGPSLDLAASRPTASPSSLPALPHPAPDPPAPAPRLPWHRRWWVWATVAGVVATGLAVGLGVAYGRDRGEDDLSVNIHFDQLAWERPPR
jgi:hypothetical protein